MQIVMNIRHCSLLTILSSIITISSAKETVFSERPAPPKICLIGIGPGGMYFLHALAAKQKQLEEQNAVDALLDLPEVTAYERASTPGGVWRDHSSGQNLEGYRMMYNDLWTNGMKEVPEFPDYTFYEHYGGKETPTFFTREHMLDYLLKRVTRDKDIFEEYNLRFDTDVTWVQYDEEDKNFEVTVVDNLTGVTSTNRFDKVVWAGGVAGKASIPDGVMNILDEGGFKGSVVHSTQFDTLTDAQIIGKRVVIIGDGDSSNDLAYLLIKRGVGRVFMTTRGGEGSAAEISSWPDNKVEMIWYKQLNGVSNDRFGLVFDPIGFDEKTQSYFFDEDSEDEISTILDITAVIFATGYKANIDFLEPSLKKAMEFKSDFWSLPKDWKMEHNLLTSTVGDVAPAEKLFHSDYTAKNIHNNVFIDNPSMFFIYENTNQQLFDLDVSARLVFAYIYGDAQIPSTEEMRERNLQRYVDEMNIPLNRKKIDVNYMLALHEMVEEDEKNYEKSKKEGIKYEMHWYTEGTYGGKYHDLIKQECEYEVKICARDIETAGYMVSFGNYTHLSSIGNDLVGMLSEFYFNKLMMESKEENNRLTYRDLDVSVYKSLYTGTQSVPYNGWWLDVDKNGCAENEVGDCGFPSIEPYVFRLKSRKKLVRHDVNLIDTLPE
eukprot:CAMPEP_0194271264 /NCGR_PEP_ID=MMETSP0169-20130528/5098_1 /TAXON_ID=218684 /ORGANISM="Corethron pennatum, Strain L29A3" /LENGTH=659 /DNA_ID=CAMNT_0039013573 /DNA_START=321 /DNA_END=2300 /DNA_ORIENTATION=+